MYSYCAHSELMGDSVMLDKQWQVFFGYYDAVFFGMVR